jgi:hypothetical protein
MLGSRRDLQTSCARKSSLLALLRRPISVATIRTGDQ